MTLTIHTTEFHCEVCHQDKVHKDSLTTGYGCDKQGRKVCFDCCGIQDRQSMRDTGKATLYLVKTDNKWFVTNWPNTLRIPCSYPRKSHHNIARYRYDIWFTFEGNSWHGIQYGDNTQICHCKRVKNSR